MEKLNMHTKDFASVNAEKLAQLFPECVTEVMDVQSGCAKRAFDYEKLRQLLATDIVEGTTERYQFTWPDKKKAIRIANAPTNMTLRPCRGESVDFDTTENLYIEGDNLEVLKLLRENYLGKIKMIYIDPPYNTGNDFVYEDDFSQATGDFISTSGQIDLEGNRLVQNTESNGRFHTDWLNMIYPRIKVAKDLLSEEGYIFISIDDIELENLRRCCDEVFGPKNFVATLTRRTKAGGGSAARHVAVENDFILVYAKNESVAGPLFAPFDEKYAQRYAHEDEKGRYFWDTMERSCTATVPYMIEAPDGTMLEGKWFRSESRFKRDLAEGEVRFLKKTDGTWSVQFKQRMAEGKKIRSILSENDFKSNPQDLEELGLGDVFSFPKPVFLMQYLVQSAIKEEQIILDFFSGSSTTAHAVLKLNANDGVKRKFIMVQLPEETDPKSEAYRAGFKNICEIGKERIRRAGKKILEEQTKSKSDGGLFANTESKPNVDVGFRVLKLDSSNMQDVYYRPEESNETTLFEDNIKPDRTSEDLLFQVMLECNLPLSAKIETKMIADKEVFSVNNGYLIACFDKDVNEDVIKAVAKMKPYYFIMRDSSLSSDNVADNFDQIFHAYSKETIRRVL